MRCLENIYFKIFKKICSILIKKKFLITTYMVVDITALSITVQFEVRISLGVYSLNIRSKNIHQDIRVF